MRQSDKPAVIAASVTALLILGSLIASFFRPAPVQEFKLRDRMQCVIALSSVADTSKSLIVGYNYYLLQKLAADKGQEVSISLSYSEAEAIDSLLHGSADIAILPYGDSIACDSVLVSRPVDSLSVWLLPAGTEIYMDTLNVWIDGWHASASFDSVRTVFLNRYDAHRSRRRDCLSPYDDIIRSWSDSLGWDWRMLAALIYHESRFHIEAVSRKGAFGLMQLMPGTAERFGLENPLDPEENIAAGARYLMHLYKRFTNVSSDVLERYKYTLASFNAGEGRIDDCIRYAEHLGVDPAWWDDVSARVIPEMSDSTALGSGAIKVGLFKGKETIAYVNEVFNTFVNMCHICPEGGDARTSLAKAYGRE